MKLVINPECPYVYETHLHTNEGSKCAVSSGAEMAGAAFEAGYTGIIVTNHFIGGNTAVDTNLPWKEWVDGFCKGYENAKAEGDKIGLQVFFGWESGFRGTEFLIFGLDKDWLYSHPEINGCTIPEQYEIVKKSGGLVIQAHPYRKEDYIPEVRVFPEFSDGAETVNATHSSKLSKSHNIPEWDDMAEKYASENNLLRTAGSDVHSVNMLGGGMAFGRKLSDINEFIEAVRNREGILLTGNESL